LEDRIPAAIPWKTFLYDDIPNPCYLSLTES